MGMLPTYIMQDVSNCIQTACWRQLKSLQPPTTNWQELARLYVHPDDHLICARAVNLYSKNVTAQTYRHRIDLESGWQNEVRVTVSADGKFYFPEIPTLDMDRDSEFYRSLVEWVEWDEDISTRWATVKAMVEEFDASNQPISVLKELWPDFDLLFNFKDRDRHRGGDTSGWVEKFRQMGRPRSFDLPVPNTMKHLSDIRRTILSVTMLPKSFDHPPGEDAYVRMTRRIETITTPWGKLIHPVTENL